MSRKKLVLGSLMVAGICAVAMVRAQEAVRSLADQPTQTHRYSERSQGSRYADQLRGASRQATSDYAPSAIDSKSPSGTGAIQAGETATAPRLLTNMDSAPQVPLATATGESMAAPGNRSTDLILPVAETRSVLKRPGTDTGSTPRVAAVPPGDAVPLRDPAPSPSLAPREVVVDEDAAVPSFAAPNETTGDVSEQRVPWKAPQVQSESADAEEVEASGESPLMSSRRVRRNPTSRSEYVPAAAPRSPSESTGGSSDGPGSRPAAVSSEPAGNRRSVEVPSAPIVASRPTSGLLVASQGPQIRVETTGPQAISVGRSGQYAVVVSNSADVDANGVHVRIALPAWVQVSNMKGSVGAAEQQPFEENADDPSVNQYVWSIDRVPARGREQLALELTPRENQPFELAVDWAMVPIGAGVQIEVQQPALEIAMSGPQEMMFGSTATFVLTVSNPGTGDAENVSVQLVSGGMAAKPQMVGSIPAGQQRKVQVELSPQQAGTLELTALATADGGLKTESVRGVQVRKANLEITVAGPPLKFAGSTATYQIRVVNKGDAPARRVVATASLPEGSKRIQVAEGLQPQADGLTWALGDLAPGGESIFLIECQLLNEGENLLGVNVRADADLSAEQIVATRVESIADLKLTVNDPKGPKPVGDDVAYEIEVTNRGTRAAEDVHIVAQFSNGIEPVRAEGQRAELVPGQVLFQPIARIEPGASVKLKVTARAAEEGNLRFRAEVHCDTPETDLVAEDTTRFYKLDVPQLGRTPSAPNTVR